MTAGSAKRKNPSEFVFAIADLRGTGYEQGDYRVLRPFAAQECSALYLNSQPENRSQYIIFCLREQENCSRCQMRSEDLQRRVVYEERKLELFLWLRNCRASVVGC
jgi:hypothetical protein